MADDGLFAVSERSEQTECLAAGFVGSFAREVVAWQSVQEA
jgi:hypothetical protein